MSKPFFPPPGASKDIAPYREPSVRAPERGPQEPAIVTRAAPPESEHAPRIAQGDERPWAPAPFEIEDRAFERAILPQHDDGLREHRRDHVLPGYRLETLVFWLAVKFPRFGGVVLLCAGGILLQFVSVTSRHPRLPLAGGTLLATLGVWFTLAGYAIDTKGKAATWWKVGMAASVVVGAILAIGRLIPG